MRRIMHNAISMDGESTPENQKKCSVCVQNACVCGSGASHKWCLLHRVICNLMLAALTWHLLFMYFECQNPVGFWVRLLFGANHTISRCFLGFMRSACITTVENNKSAAGTDIAAKHGIFSDLWRCFKRLRVQKISKNECCSCSKQRRKDNQSRWKFTTTDT